MSWKRTLLAFTIFILMIMAYVLDTQILRNRILSEQETVSLAHSVNVRDVDQIFLKNAQGSVHIIRTSVGWRIKQPIDAPADPEIIDTMLTNVTSARRRNQTTSNNLAQYGLATPEIELTLGTDTARFGDWGTSFSVQLGYESTYTGQVFGRYPTKDFVFTVGEHVRNSLLRSPLDFRRSRLFDIDTGSLEKYTTFRIAQPSGEAVTLTNTNNTWSITEPAEATAEQKVVSEYFNRLGMLRAMTYVSAQSDRPTSLTAAQAALTSPVLSISLEGKDTKPQHLNVAVAEGPDGSVYVAQRPGEQEIMVLTSETVDELRRKAQYFRSRDLFTLKADEVGLFTVQIARAAPTAMVRNDKGEWELVGDPEFRLKQQVISDSLNTLVSLRVEEYVDLNPVDVGNYGLDNPRIRFNITSKDKKKVETLEVGSAQDQAGGASFARSSNDKGIFTVQLSPDLFIIGSSIADKNIFAADPARLARVELVVDGKTYELKKDGNDWKLLKPGQSNPAPIDIRQVATLVAMMNGLVYERDITSEGSVIVAPDPGPPLSVRFYGPDDLLLNEMNVKARVNRQVITAANGRGRTFEMRAQAIDQIYALSKEITR